MSLLDGITIEVGAKHALGRPRRLLERCPSKPDERRVGQSIPEVLGEPCSAKVIVAAVSLIRDHDDVLSLAQRGEARAHVITLLLREHEALDRGEDNPASVAIEHITKLGVARRLLGCVCQ